MVARIDAELLTVIDESNHKVMPGGLPKMPEPVDRPNGFALFALGFRPFFLAAGVAALGQVAVWGLGYTSGHPTMNFYAGFNWHAHEMLFGYTAAVIAGFLLTAARNWTGLDTLRGPPLAMLLALWLAARVVSVIPAQVPGALIALIDVAFLPWLGFAVATPLLRARQPRNLVLIAIVLLLAVTNGLMHLQALGVPAFSAFPATDTAVALVVLLIAIVGGRVVPFFTEKALSGVQCRRRPVLERLAIASVVLYGVCVSAAAPAPVIGAVAAAAALVHGARLQGWYSRRTWSVSLLWVLYCGYGWLVAGFALTVATAAGWLPGSIATHAFTSGAIGVVTLGMMARVALGHTGRPMRATRSITTAFVLVNLSAIARVFGPILLPQSYVALMGVASGLWLAAFLIFIVVYVPILVRPRVDGRPG